MMHLLKSDVSVTSLTSTMRPHRRVQLDMSPDTARAVADVLFANHRGGWDELYDALQAAADRVEGVEP